MFPCTHFTSLGRVDNLDVIPETRLNKYLQLCNQYYRLHMARAAWIDVYGCFFEPYVYRNMSMGFSSIFKKPSFAGTYRIASDCQ